MTTTDWTQTPMMMEYTRRYGTKEYSVKPYYSQSTTMWITTTMEYLTEKTQTTTTMVFQTRLRRHSKDASQGRNRAHGIMTTMG